MSRKASNALITQFSEGKIKAWTLCGTEYRRYEP